MIIRYFFSVSLGLLVAIGLLWLMQFLIDIGPEVFVDEPRKVRLAWLAERKPELIDDDFEPPDRLPPPVEPPRYQPPANGRDGIVIDPPTDPGAEEPSPEWEGPVLRMTDGPLVAVMNVQPVYPVSAAGRSLEGHVVVQFDVSAEGSVTDVVVIESSHRVFERPAIDAALRSRYRPRVVDGVAVMTTGVRMLYRFEFKQ
jgi:protein TonB